MSRLHHSVAKFDALLQSRDLMALLRIGKRAAHVKLQ